MPTTQTLEIVIRLRDLASTNIRRLGRAVTGMRSGVRATSNAVFSLHSAFLGLGAGLIARSFINVASSFEQMEIKLDALTKGRGRQTLEEINEWAKRMPVDTRKAVDTFAMMQALGLDPTIDKMQTLVDVSVLFGEDTMPRVARALGQMQTLGRLSSEELNQLAEAGINARGILRDAFGGKTVEEIQKSGIEITKITDAIWAGLRGQYAGAAEKAQDTWSGLMITIKSEFVDAQKLITEAGLFDFLKANLQELLAYFDSLSEAELDKVFEETAQKIIDGLKLMAKAVAIAGDAWRGWKLIWYGLQVVYGSFSAWLNDQLLTLGKVIDLFLTDAEKGILEIAKAVEVFGKIAGIDLGISDALKSLEGMSKKMDGFVEASENAKGFWTDIVKEANKNLEATAKEESLLSRVNGVMASIEERAEAIRVKREDSGVLQRMADAWEAFSTDVVIEAEVVPVVKAASPLTEAKARVTELKAITDAQTKIFASQFEKQEITLEQFYAERLRMTEELYNAELVLLQIKEKAEKKVDKKRIINAQILALEQQHQADLLALSDDRIQAEDDQRQQTLEKEIQFQELKQREITAASTGAGIASQFTLELLELDKKHSDELAKIGDHQENKALLEETYRVQKLEKERLLADQQIRLQELILAAASKTTGDVATAFRDLYAATGKETKAFFHIYKAAAIATAIIDTYASAIAVYKTMAEIPIVGAYLAPIAAAAAIAAGAAKIATIRQQSLAKGGEVHGESPHAKSDNVPIWATAGEYMQPVEAVKYYGRNVMNAIRQRLIPREALANFSVPDIVKTTQRHFQAGGAITAASAKQQASQAAAGAGSEDKINITNVTDPNLMGTFLQSKPGEQQILNIISENSHLVKTSLFAREG